MNKPNKPSAGQPEVIANLQDYTLQPITVQEIRLRRPSNLPTALQNVLTRPFSYTPPISGWFPETGCVFNIIAPNFY